MKLTPKDGGTLLSYDVEAQIGGKLAQLGQRLVNGAAKKIADDFFQKFAAGGQRAERRMTRRTRLAAHHAMPVGAARARYSLDRRPRRGSE